MHVDQFGLINDSCMQYAAQQLEKKAEEWEENYILQAAKRLANLMSKMDKYTKYVMHQLI